MCEFEYTLQSTVKWHSTALKSTQNTSRNIAVSLPLTEILGSASILFDIVGQGDPGTVFKNINSRYQL